MASLKMKKLTFLGCLSREELVELTAVRSEDADNMDEPQLRELAATLFPDWAPIPRKRKLRA